MNNIEGKRKLIVVIAGLLTEAIGLALTVWSVIWWKNNAMLMAGIFTTFTGGVVALCGLFFGYNTKEHKAKNGGK